MHTSNRHRQGFIEWEMRSLHLEAIPKVEEQLSRKVRHTSIQYNKNYSMVHKIIAALHIGTMGNTKIIVQIAISVEGSSGIINNQLVGTYTATLSQPNNPQQHDY